MPGLTGLLGRFRRGGDDSQIEWLFKGGSGRSIDDAVVIIGAAHSGVGVWLEMAWISTQHRQHNQLTQSLIGGDGGAFYDQIDIELPSGEQISYYFDITDFYAKTMMLHMENLERQQDPQVLISDEPESENQSGTGRWPPKPRG